MRLLLSTTFSFFSLALAEKESEASTLRLRRRMTAKNSSVGTYIGNGNVQNLGRCEGDCDRDSDCAKGLICHQRNAGDKVHGCTLEPSLFSSGTDFCVPAPPITPPTNQTTTLPPPTTSGKTPAKYIAANPKLKLGLCEGDCDKDEDCGNGLRCHQRSRGEGAPGCELSGKLFSNDYDYCVQDTTPNVKSFALKLYWEQGYFWQEETTERKWCLSCRDNCREKDEIVIYNCDIKATKWEFVSQGPNEVQIKVAGRDVCIQRNSGTDLELEQCDSSNQEQRFLANGGSFNDRRFEVSPKQRQDWCMTQRHHPKSDEFVNIEPCTTARRSQTSYWNKY